MQERTFGIFAHKIVQTNSYIYFGVQLILIVLALATIRTLSIRNNRMLLIVLAIFTVYSLAVLYTNWASYQKTGIFTLAVQGRYLLPALLVFYGIGSGSLFKIFGSTHKRLSVVIISLIAMVFVSSSLFSYIGGTTPEWHTNQTKNLNQNLKRLIFE